MLLLKLNESIILIHNFKQFSYSNDTFTIVKDKNPFSISAKKVYFKQNSIFDWIFHFFTNINRVKFYLKLNLLPYIFNVDLFCKTVNNEQALINISNCLILNYWSMLKLLLNETRLSHRTTDYNQSINDHNIKKVVNMCIILHFHVTCQ